ncbi:hypothetical protein BDZ89DRAFT_1055330 [Hymenopellis radicata]|nr:hypothetical protein BDZ89DRAFT_1055330 [Hymenopellis radicata]
MAEEARCSQGILEVGIRFATCFFDVLADGFVTRADEVSSGAAQTSTSHRVTESSGDSTRVGHVGVRTRVTRESRTHESERGSEYWSVGQQTVRNVSRTRCARLSCPIRQSGPSPEATHQRLIECYLFLLDHHHDHHHHPGSDDCPSAALTIVRQPVGCGFVIWICAGPAAAGPVPVADLENE